MRDLFVLCVVGGIVAHIWLRRGEATRFEMTVDPARVLMAAVGVFGPKRRWSTLTLSGQNASFGGHKSPNGLIAVALLLAFVVPGIVYLLLGGKREEVFVMTAAGPGPHSTVQVTSNGYRGKFAGRLLRKRLAIPAGGPPPAGSAAALFW